MFRSAPIFLSMLLIGCASSANDIQPTYVSTLQYRDLSCDQIAAEAERISDRVAQLSGQQDSKSTNDAVATGVAIVLFWPAAFLIKGDGATAAELGRLKGEFEALQKLSIQKRCSIELQQR